MSRFLIVTLPLTGHAHRAVAIADELSAHGHEVAWCGPKGYFRPLLGPDATLFPTGARLFREQAGHGIAVLTSLWLEYLIPMARFMLPAADRAVREAWPWMPGVIENRCGPVEGAVRGMAGAAPDRPRGTPLAAPGPSAAGPSGNPGGVRATPGTGRRGCR